METKQKVHMLETNLDRLLNWISGVNTTTSFLFTVTTTMLGTIAFLSPDLPKWTISSAVAAAITIIFLLASLLMSSFVYFPRTKGPKGSLIYFSGISNMGTNQYETAIRELSDNDYLADLAYQCHRNAEIAQIKYSWFQRAMISLYLSTLPWAISIYLLYQLRP